MKRSAIGLGLGFGGLVVGTLMMLGTSGCTFASPTHITATQDVADDKDGGASSSSSSSSSSSGGAAGGGAAGVCAADDWVTPDLAKLTACGDNKGHCFAKTKTPMADTFRACPNAAEVCVPDELLLAGGKPLKACTSIIGAGGCINMKLIPEMEKRGGSALKQDVCEAHQICAPCVDPTNNGADTGLCKPIGVHEKECGAGAGPGGGGTEAPKAAAPGCCTSKGKSNGMCMAVKDLPPAQVSKTIQDTCADADRCVPTAMVSGTAVKCDSGLLGPGLCLDGCFNKMLSIAGGIGVLSKEGCGETEVCAPCRFIKDQGAPGCE